MNVPVLCRDQHYELTASSVWVVVLGQVADACGIWENLAVVNYTATTHLHTHSPLAESLTSASNIGRQTSSVSSVSSLLLIQT